MLTDSLAIEILLRNMDLCRKKYGFKLLAYVIMPEHVHLVILPTIDLRLGLMIREIRSHTAREYFAKNLQMAESARRTFWMARCYDHNCRDKESVRQKIDYCHWNPVKRGLASKPDQYEWSSHRAYSGVGRVPIEVDCME